MNTGWLIFAVLFWAGAWALNAWLVRLKPSDPTQARAINLAVPLIFGVTVLVVWEGVVHGFNVSPILLPAPSAIWERLIKYAVPLQATILLFWWLYLSASAYAPNTWYNPFEPYSVMTCLVQWGTAIALFVVLNKWIVRRNVEIA